jgi:hypothetical protein
MSEDTMPEKLSSHSPLHEIEKAADEYLGKAVAFVEVGTRRMISSLSPCDLIIRSTVGYFLKCIKAHRCYDYNGNLKDNIEHEKDQEQTYQTHPQHPQRPRYAV